MRAPDDIAKQLEERGCIHIGLPWRVRYCSVCRKRVVPQRQWFKAAALNQPQQVFCRGCLIEQVLTPGVGECFGTDSSVPCAATSGNSTQPQSPRPSAPAANLQDKKPDTVSLWHRLLSFISIWAE